MVGVKELEFEAVGQEDDDDSEEECDSLEMEDHDEGELEFEGEFAVNLLNGTSTPDFGIAQIVPGVYLEIEMELAPVLPSGNTIQIRATLFTSSGDQYIIEYSDKFSAELEIESSSGIEINEGTLNSILVMVDLDALFEGVDFGSAQVDGEGIIHINNSINVSIAEQIRANFKDAIDVGEDENGDNEIDD